MTHDDYETVQAMRRYGGRFVRALAVAAEKADPQNLFIIKTAWPHYWAKYAAMAEHENEVGQ